MSRRTITEQAVQDLKALSVVDKVLLAKPSNDNMDLKMSPNESKQDLVDSQSNRVRLGSERPGSKEVVDLVLRASHEPTDAACGDDRWSR